MGLNIQPDLDKKCKCEIGSDADEIVWIDLDGRGEFRQCSWVLQVSNCSFTKYHCESWKFVCVCCASEGLVIYRLQPGSSRPPSGWVALRNWVPPERLFWKVGYLPALIPQEDGTGRGRGQAPEGWSPFLPATRQYGKSHLGTQLWKYEWLVVPRDGVTNYICLHVYRTVL